MSKILKQYYKVKNNQTDIWKVQFLPHLRKWISMYWFQYHAIHDY